VRRARRLDRILEAGAALLHERGFHGLTMRLCARAAGTSLANLYHYVGGREDLVYQVERRILEAAVASAQAVLAVPGARDRLRALLADHLRRVLARPYEAAVLTGRPGPLRGDRARRIDESRKRYLGLVRAVTDAAVRRSPVGRDADLLATALLGAADRIALDAVRRRATPPPDRTASRILALFLTRPPRGEGRQRSESSRGR
jgi:AcrR family transcriptional regulator